MFGEVIEGYEFIKIISMKKASQDNIVITECGMI